MSAHESFISAVLEYADGPRARSRGKWRLVRRRLGALRDEVRKCEAFVEEPGDEAELQVLAWFLTQRGVPFVTYWEATIETVAGGTLLTINLGDMPPWTNGDPK
jgi:hypothetical protein